MRRQGEGGRGGGISWVIFGCCSDEKVFFYVVFCFGYYILDCFLVVIFIFVIYTNRNVPIILIRNDCHYHPFLMKAQPLSLSS